MAYGIAAVKKEDTLSVMLLAMGLALLIILLSVFFLWIITNDLYLDSYFAVEAFFDAQNTAASTALASLAFSLPFPKLASIFVIVAAANISRILVVSFIIAAVVDFLGEANVESTISGFRARRLRGHVILCGYSTLTKKLMDKLDVEKVRYLVVDPSKESAAELQGLRVLSLAKDFTDSTTLEEAGIKKARAIIFTDKDDVKNTLGSLAARGLNKKALVLSRIENEHIRRKVYALGVNMTVIPERLAGLEVGEFVLKSM